jgi:hypothetical protein
VKEGEVLNLVPTEVGVVKLHKIWSSAMNSVNQSMTAELKRRTVSDGTVIDPVNELVLLDDVSQVTVIGVANVGRSFWDAEPQRFVHGKKDVLVRIFSLTSELGNFEANLDQDGERCEHILKRVIERQPFEVLSLVARIEWLAPFDPDFVLVDLLGSVLVLDPVLVISSDVLGAELDAALSDGRSNKCDESLDVDNSQENSKTIFLKVVNIIFDTRLQLDVTKICATFNQLDRCLTRIVKNQDHSSRVSEHYRDATFLAFVGPTLYRS